MPELKIAIANRPAVTVAGYKIRTAMADVAGNCRKVWEDFMPAMNSFPVDPAHAGESFGVSLGVDPDSFDYYAAMALKKGAPIPAGMERVELAAGPYCQCRVASLADIAPAFMHIYTNWIETQDKYAFAYDLPGYELYGREYPDTGAVTIYCPLREK